MEHEFRSTHWSIVIAAGRESSPDSQRALASLCEIYWYPLYAYARRRVQNDHEAQDLTQAFFAELLEKKLRGCSNSGTREISRIPLDRLQELSLQAIGKKGEHRSEEAGGLRSPWTSGVQILVYASSPQAGVTAQQCYDQQWAIALLEQTLGRLKEEFEQLGKAEQFTLLRGFIIGDHSGTTYGQVAEKLEISEAAARKSASRMRQRYRQLLREEIAQTVSRPDEIEDEIRNLFVTLDL